MYPTIKPSLNLDFANVRRLDPRITFTRASSGTYFNEFGLLVTAAANVPRFDYNPVTGESLGLLIEEQRTNLLRYSEQFDNAAWTKANTTITANAEIAPDGLLTADKLVENTANSTHTVENSATLVSGTTYTSSVSIKAGGRPTIQMVLLGTAFTESRTWFDLSTGVSTTTIGTIVSASIVSQGNGWYRVSVTQTATASGAGTISLRLWNGSTALYTGDGTSGIYIWGAQLEVGAFPTSYIKTEGSQVTRAADSAVMTGSNFSNWYNPLEGTFVAEYAASSLINNPGAFAAGDSSLSFGARSTIYLVNSSGISGRATLNVSVSGATQAGIAPAYTPVANTLYKVSASYKVNDFAICVNGGSVAVDTNGSVPTATNFSFSIGSLNSAWVTGSNHLNGTIKRIAYYPRRLSDAQLQALTG